MSSAFPKSVVAFAVRHSLRIRGERCGDGSVIFSLLDERGDVMRFGGRTYTQSASGFLSVLREHVRNVRKAA